MNSPNPEYDVRFINYLWFEQHFNIIVIIVIISIISIYLYCALRPYRDQLPYLTGTSYPTLLGPVTQPTSMPVLVSRF